MSKRKRFLLNMNVVNRKKAQKSQKICVNLRSSVDQFRLENVKHGSNKEEFYPQIDTD